MTGWTAARRAWRAAAITAAALALAAAPASAAPDYDADGALPPADCAPLDAAVHPGAPDLPDLTYEDTNCDGIDGARAAAVFVSPAGSDAAAGTAEAPFATVAKAVSVAAAGGLDVYVAVGRYEGSVTITKPMGIYGGYSPDGFKRPAPGVSEIAGSPQALLIGGARVVLQMVSATGTADGSRNAYGIRAVSGSAVGLVDARVLAGRGTDGGSGYTPAGRALGGSTGAGGASGDCDGAGGSGGAGGWGANFGGEGGDGREGNSGTSGADGAGYPGSGGAGGLLNGNATQRSGTSGLPGLAGGTGSPGADGGNSLAIASQTWNAPAPGWGGLGGSGSGGGGGGGGGGQAGAWVTDGGGAGGGGGGGGGYGGSAGGPGANGGGSFALYLHASSAFISDSSELRATGGGNGGLGGAGQQGGAGAGGGPGGSPTSGCWDEVGPGGSGGRGGDGGWGGRGGDGAGGPSAAVFRVQSVATVVGDANKLLAGPAGAGALNGTQAPNGQAGSDLATGVASLTPDVDADGVLDSADACPTLAGPALGTACPARPAALTDRDADGIPDGVDSCPDAPGGADADADGCTDQPPSGGGTTPPPADGPAGRLKVLPSKVTLKSARRGKFTVLRRFAATAVPAGARVTVTCKAPKGRRCPARRVTYTAARTGTITFRAFVGKRLAARTALTVRITLAGYVDLYRRVTVRVGRPPLVSSK